MAAWDVVVVGCGVSGATFAHFAARKGLRVLVLEKDRIPGGSFATHTFADGFRVELGAHTIYSSYAAFIQVLEELGLAGEVVPRGRAPYRMCVGGKVVSLLTGVRYGEAALYLPRFLLGRPGKAGKSVRQYYAGILGPSNYEALFRPVLGAIISQDPGDFPAEILLKRRPRNPSYPRSFTLRTGLRSFVEAAAGQEGVTLHTGAEVISVRRGDEGYSVTLAGGEEIAAARVCLAGSATATADLLASLDAGAAQLLRQVAPTVTVESLGVAARKEAVGIPPFAFIIAKGEAFSSVVSRDVLPHAERRGFAVHFPGPGPEREEKLERIRALLQLRGAEVDSADAVHVAPRLTVGHADRVRALDVRFRHHQGLFVVGNYFDGLAIEDCVLRSRSEAARL